MVTVYVILLIVAFFLLLLFAFDAKVEVVFDTDRNDIHASVCWLYPFVKGVGRMDSSTPVLDIYLFSMHLFRKNILKKNTKNSKSRKRIKKQDLLKIFEPKGLSIDTRYGFIHPSTTGITCGAVNTAAQFINIDYFNQVPDFMSAHDYIYFDAKASVNLGASLINLIEYYKNRRNLQWIRAQT